MKSSLANSLIFFLVVAKALMLSGCRSRESRAPKDGDLSDIASGDGATHGDLSQIFSRPKTAEDGTVYVTVLSSDVPVFSYSSQPLSTANAWEYVEKASRQGGKILGKVREGLRLGSIKSRNAAEEAMQKAGSGSVAGPGLYAAPNAFVSQEYGNNLIFSCLAKGAKIALQEANTQDGKQGSGALASEFPVVAYQWYKGVALVIRDPQALAKNSTIAMANQSGDVDPSLVAFAAANQAGVCSPVKAVLAKLNQHKFDPKALAADVFGPTLSTTIALAQVMQPRMERYLKSWPTHVNLGGEDVTFASKSPNTVVQCLQEMLVQNEVTASGELPQFKEELDGMCPWGKDFATYLKGLGDLVLSPRVGFEGFYTATMSPALAREFSQAKGALHQDTGTLRSELAKTFQRGDHILSWLLFGGHPDFAGIPSLLEQTSFERLRDLGL